jgi:hypothetical protein
MNKTEMLTDGAGEYLEGVSADVKAIELNGLVTVNGEVWDIVLKRSGVEMEQLDPMGCRMNSGGEYYWT